MLVLACEQSAPKEGTGDSMFNTPLLAYRGGDSGTEDDVDPIATATASEDHARLIGMFDVHEKAISISLTCLEQMNAVTAVAG
jgi:hypothetical protein